MGTCPPLSILGEEGCFGKQQNNIQNLSLITGSGCYLNCPHEGYDTLPLIDFSGFHNLRALSWKEAESANDLTELSWCLAACRNTIESLTIDVVGYERAGDAWHLQYGGELDESFLPDVLDLDRDDSKLVYPSLRELSLSNIGFNDMISETLHGLNFWSLESLRLHNCCYMDNFLECVSSENQVINLKSFELSMYQEGMQSTQYLRKLFSLIHGLERLYIHLDNFEEWSTVMSDVMRHKSSLQRIVLYEFHDPDDRYIPYPPSAYLPVLAASTLYDHSWREEMNKLLECRGLRAVGLTSHPESLVRKSLFLH